MDRDHKAERGHFPIILKGAGILFLSSMVGKVLIFLFSLFIAKMLSPSDLGIYYLSSTIVFLLGIAAVGGLDSGAIRFVSLFHGRKENYRVIGTILASLSLIIPASLAIGLSIFFFSGFMGKRIFDKPELEEALAIFAFAIPFFSIGKLLVASMIGLNRMEFKAFNDLLEISLRFLLTFLMVSIMGLGVKGGVLGWVFSCALGSLFIASLSMKVVSRLEKTQKPILEYGGLVRFSYPQVFSEFLICAAAYTDILILGIFRSSEEVGIYTIAARLALSGILISESFRLVFAPIVSDLHSKGNFKELAHLFKMVSRWAFTLSLPIFIFFILLGKEILAFFGERFVEASTCLSILSFAHILSVAAGPANYMVLMSGRSGLNLLNHFIALIINLSLNYFLIPKHGILGAALATSISIIGLEILRLIETFYLMRIHPFQWNYLKPLLSGLISTITILYLRAGDSKLPLYFESILFVSFYLILLVASKVNKEEILIFRKLWDRKRYFPR